MKNIEILTNALIYIENNLECDIRTDDVARECFCSKSTLEKLFRCVNDIAVKDYIVRRRMMKAAHMLLNQPKKGILDIALQYGYGSNEAFTRAFKQVWNCKPSEFRKEIGKKRFSELYPRLGIPVENGDEYIMKRKPFDISELYDLFVERKNCYIICSDIKELGIINDISRKAGDKAIVECLKRMENVAGENDVVFRVGGDEFVILMDSENISDAEILLDKLEEYNKNTFVFEENEIPLRMHIGITKIADSNIRYSELFVKIHNAILDSK